MPGFESLVQYLAPLSTRRNVDRLVTLKRTNECVRVCCSYHSATTVAGACDQRCSDCPKTSVCVHHSWCLQQTDGVSKLGVIHLDPILFFFFFWLLFHFLFCVQHLLSFPFFFFVLSFLCPLVCNENSISFLLGGVCVRNVRCVCERKSVCIMHVQCVTPCLLEGWRRVSVGMKSGQTEIKLG